MGDQVKQTFLEKNFAKKESNIKIKKRQNMNKEELEFISQEGEGLKIEFKESFDKSIAKEIVAFANSEGGKIFLGIDDNGKVKGIEITNKLKSQIQDIARNCDPSVKLSLEEFENILIVDVKKGKDKPYKCHEGFYLREGPNSQKLKRDEILKLITELGKIKFDEQINDAFRFPADFDEKRFLEFLKKSNISRTISIKEILVNLSLGAIIKKKFKLNNAGILLFAKNPERFFRQNFVTCVLYKGKEKVDIIDRKDFNNDLLTNYENTFAFLKQHLRLEYEIKGYGPRKEIPEIPYEALREAIINSLIHRDYFEDRFGIFVEIFDDRVEITNYGKLLFDKKDLGRISMPRNPILFDIFYRMHLIEKVGSGIKRIKKQIRERGLKVKFETNEFFRIVFYRPKEMVKTVVKTVVKILALIEENPKITREELSEKTGLTIRGVEWNLAKLKQKGLLKRIGPAKGGHWKIKKLKTKYG